MRRHCLGSVSTRSILPLAAAWFTLLAAPSFAHAPGASIAVRAPSFAVAPNSLRQEATIQVLMEEVEPPPLVPLMSVFAAGVAVLLTLILFAKLPAFLALLVASLTISVGATLVNEEAAKLTELGGVLQQAMGDALGLIATVIGVGSIFGAVLEHSGGTEVLGKTLVEYFGTQRAPWAMLLTGFIVSIPVFLDVGLVILAPLLAALSQQTGRDILHFGLPLVVGLAVTHGFVPPTPGPIAVASFLGAPLGYVIFFGLMVGLPTAMICGPLLCSAMVGCIGRDANQQAEAREADSTVEMVAPKGDAEQVAAEAPVKEPPSFRLVLGCIGMPIVLILTGTVIEQVASMGIPSNVSGDARREALKERLASQPLWAQILHLVGSPIVALLVSTLWSMFILGAQRGTSKDELLQLANKSLEPAGNIILITGAGGMFKGVLGSSGITAALQFYFNQSSLNPLVLAWLVASVIRAAQGSATVAMITTAGILADLTDENNPPSQAYLALTACAISSGSVFLSHVNDSGFWMISRYMKMSEKETLMTWTPISVAISVVSFAIIMLISVFVS